jgi:hypothetical protein
MPPRSEREKTLDKLHQLTAKIEADPSQKLNILKEFYTQQLQSDEPLVADLALTMRVILQAGNPMTETNQTHHAKTVSPIFICGMVCSTIVALACILGGCYVFRGPAASTQISILGASITTQNIAVAMVFLGIVGLVFIVRSTIAHAAYSKST